MIETEAVVIGAGPAGSVAALNLAPFQRVVLIDRSRVRPRIGESLVPAANKLLSDMRLYEAFCRQGHLPWYGKRAVWSDNAPYETDFLRDPDGSGWHLDRQVFEKWLREEAVKRGAQLICPATISRCERIEFKWQILLSTVNGPIAISADVLIDAGGRTSPMVRQFGAARRSDAQLVCLWTYGSDRNQSDLGLTLVEAIQEGWWYSAPLPKGRRVLAFHTDPDLLPATIVERRTWFGEKAIQAKELSALLTRSGFVPESRLRSSGASGGCVIPTACGESGWLATGDAAISFDPLASQGLLNALFTGLAAAEATDQHLRGDPDAFSRYAEIIGTIGRLYRDKLVHSYAEENRWPNAPFWYRRR